MVGGWATIFEFKDGGWLATEQGKWVGAAHEKKRKKRKSQMGIHWLPSNWWLDFDKENVNFEPHDEFVKKEESCCRLVRFFGVIVWL